ncbi:MAG: hypothetical protein Gaeavirus1_41 [Gaeavirus sp.]|uniref:Uncharacterized protein n=1 Tax=Gaeavirus sp. TaxID=2487767 RepID=A0A3G5A064_9VIRU|nr:MAG: hypothetical protein Gaeavirus1_41 [Gaeavirus sp.]
MTSITTLEDRCYDMRFTKATKRNIRKLFKKISKWIRNYHTFESDPLIDDAHMKITQSFRGIDYRNSDGSFIERDDAYDLAKCDMYIYSPQTTAQRFDITSIIVSFLYEARKKYGIHDTSDHIHIKFVHHHFVRLVISFLQEQQDKNHCKIKLFRTDTEFKWTKHPDCYQFYANITKIKFDSKFYVFDDLTKYKCDEWYDPENLMRTTFFITATGM